MSTLTRDPQILREITFNVHDEMCGPKTHEELYKDFLSSIDIKFCDVRKYTPSNETFELNIGMERLYGNPPIERALGALFFDEAMSMVMVEKVGNGLRNQGYGSSITDFWDIHIEIEKNHSESVDTAFLRYPDDIVSQGVFNDGFYCLLSLVEKFWDRIEYLLVK